MAKSSKGPPIGFGRQPPLPEGKRERYLDGEECPEPPAKKEPEPPLVVPIFVDGIEQIEILNRYNLFPLTPLSAFEQQLVQVIAALEKRVRELDPDL